MPVPERGRAVLGAALGIALAGGVVFALWRLAASPTGPVEVPWDRVACAHCRMLVSDPRFAGQVHLHGQVQFFDDPGCLLLALDEAADPGARAWLHDFTSERWLPLADARFVRVPESPMNYGFAARPARVVPEALDARAALAALRARVAEAPR